MFRSTRSLWGWGVALALLGARAHAQPENAPEREAAEPPSPAATAPATSKAQARRHYAAGVESYEAGQFKDAIDHFLEANRLAPSPALSFNIARAYEKLGDIAGALAFYRDYLRRASDAEDRDEVGQIVTEFENRLRQKGVQQVTVLSEPDRATVVLDGKPVGVTPWTGEIFPGQHRLQLRLPGYEQTDQVFSLTAHRAKDVSVALVQIPEEPKPETAPAPPPPPAPAPPEPATPPSEPPADTSGPATVSPWTWVSLGVGAGALGGALAFELMRASAEDDAHNAETQIEAQEQYDTMESRQLVARVLVGVGAAATVAGGVLLYLDLTAEPSTQSAGLGFGCSPSACGVTASGRF